MVPRAAVVLARGLSCSLTADVAGTCGWCWALCWVLWSLLSLLHAGDGRAALRAHPLSSWLKAHWGQEVLEVCPTVGEDLQIDLHVWGRSWCETVLLLLLQQRGKSGCLLGSPAGAFVHLTPVLGHLQRCHSPAYWKQHCKPLTRLCLCSTSISNMPLASPRALLSTLPV